MIRSVRILSSTALAVMLAFAISACQKQAKTDMSQTSDTTQVSQGYGNETTPPAQTSPEAQPGAQGATLPKEKPATRTHSKGGAGSSSAPGPSATYAEKHMIEIPAGTTFEVEMITPVDTRTSNVGDRV